MNQIPSRENTGQTIGRLWFESFHGMLSTHAVKFAGYPFGSLLPICRDAQANPLLLISHLAQHTQNLDKDPRCSLTLIRSEHADVLQWTRLTCLADAEPVTAGSALERYCRYFPDGQRYHKELNFSLYRLRPKQFYLIAGFGSARWYDVSRVLDAPHFHTAAELEILYQLNAHDHELLKRFLVHLGLEIPDHVQAVGADPQGLDARLGAQLTRLHFSNPITDENSFVTQLEALLTNG
jgi:putative heme iron utilization protein